jgi:hypothetical protein
LVSSPTHFFFDPHHFFAITAYCSITPCGGNQYTCPLNRPNHAPPPVPDANVDTTAPDAATDGSSTLEDVADTGPEPETPTPEGGYVTLNGLAQEERACSPFSGHGPYPVGVTTLEIAGPTGEVWYPAAAAGDFLQPAESDGADAGCLHRRRQGQPEQIQLRLLGQRLCASHGG